MSDHHSENLVKYAIAPKEHCARAAGGFSITTVSASPRPLGALQTPSPTTLLGT